MRWASSCGASWCANMRLASRRSSSASSRSAGRALSAAGVASWRSRRAANSRRKRGLAASTSPCRTTSGGRWATNSSC
eukprot:7399975-Alexandrium_andersonii.AAC.1